MLYQLYETQRAMLSPFAEFASASSKLYSHPLSPFAHAVGSQRMAAGFDLLHRLTKEYEKPPFGITAATVGGVEVAVQEQVVQARPFCRLLRFKRYTDNAQALERMRSQPAVLVVAPLSGHHATLLRDTVRTLLQDHKVYITDWVDARMVPMTDGAFHLHDYVHYVQDFLRLIGPDVNVISVCQPTVPVLAAVSLMASNGEPTPKAMVMMGGPIDARKSPTAVNDLAINRSHEWFENNVIYRVPQNFPGAGRRVYPGFMQYTGFVAMNPDRHVNSQGTTSWTWCAVTRKAPTPTARSTTSTTPCWTCRPSTTWRPSRRCSRTSPWSTAPGTSAASWCARRTSRPPR